MSHDVPSSRRGEQDKELRRDKGGGGGGRRGGERAGGRRVRGSGQDDEQVGAVLSWLMGARGAAPKPEPPPRSRSRGITPPPRSPPSPGVSDGRNLEDGPSPPPRDREQGEGVLLSPRLGLQVDGRVSFVEGLQEEQNDVDGPSSPGELSAAQAWVEHSRASVHGHADVDKYLWVGDSDSNHGEYRRVASSGMQWVGGAVASNHQPCNDPRGCRPTGAVSRLAGDEVPPQTGGGGGGGGGGGAGGGGFCSPGSWKAGEVTVTDESDLSQRSTPGTSTRPGPHNNDRIAPVHTATSQARDMLGKDGKVDEKKEGDGDEDEDEEEQFLLEVIERERRRRRAAEMRERILIQKVNSSPRFPLTFRKISKIFSPLLLLHDLLLIAPSTDASWSDLKPT